MKRLILLGLLVLGACAKPKAEDPAVCVPYSSAYLVEYPQGVRKSDVSICEGGYYRARSVDGALTLESTSLTIQLNDQNGTPYLTTFRGQ